MKTLHYFTLFTLLLSGMNAMAQTKNKMNSIQIQKTVQIKADLQTVYNQVVFLENFPNWSPFLEADPTQTYEVTGTDGQVGAQYHWEGNKGKDLGSQEIKSIHPQQKVLMQCDIQKPFKAQPTFSYSFKQEGEYVVVTQDFSLPAKRVDKFFMKLFGGVKSIQKMNERGLELLKTTCEN